MKEYTVNEFIELYESGNADEAFDISNFIADKYVPFEEKVMIVSKIVDLCGFDIEDNTKLNSNSVSEYLFNILNKISLFTCIKIDWHNAVDEYDALKKHKLIDLLLRNVDKEELEEYDRIYNMVKSDFYKNNYSSITYFDREVERIVKALEPFLNKVWEDIKATDFGEIIAKLGAMESEDAIK